MKFNQLSFLCFFLFCYIGLKSQNTGIGTFHAKNSLHISMQADNPVKDPLRIDSLQLYKSMGDTTLLVCDPDSGVIRYLPMNSLVAKSRIFYPPSIPISITETSTGKTLDLHQVYINLFNSPMVSSPSAGALPTYSESELDYYVLDYDTNTFDNVSMNDQGILTYDIIAIPGSTYAYFNVVFKVR